MKEIKTVYYIKSPGFTTKEAILYIIKAFAMFGIIRVCVKIFVGI